MNAIDCSQMIPPKESKMAYYEEYYLKTNELPHGILVDENDCLTDGYVSYLIAQKYNLKQNMFRGLEIYRVESEVPHKKIVAGRHVAFKNGDITIKSEKYKDSLKHVQDAFDGYYTTVDLVGKIPAEKSGLYARMTSEGIFTVIASSTRSALSEGVTLTSGGASVSTPKIANDGERNDRSRGVEIINFMASECDTLGSFCADHAGENITLTFNGEKPYSMPLPKEQAEALAKVHAVSKVFTSLRKVQNEKNRLEKQLMISRSQQARTFDESSDND